MADIVPVAAACAQAGADGVSMINTVAGMAVDPYTMRPALGGVTGGLSGPAIRPVAVGCVWRVHAALPDLPILGMGGIGCGLDALQFILAGASAVSVIRVPRWGYSTNCTTCCWSVASTDCPMRSAGPTGQTGRRDTMPAACGLIRDDFSGRYRTDLGRMR